jgi:hypothetical protein
MQAKPDKKFEGRIREQLQRPVDFLAGSEPSTLPF